MLHQQQTDKSPPLVTLTRSFSDGKINQHSSWHCKWKLKNHHIQHIEVMNTDLHIAHLLWIYHLTVYEEWKFTCQEWSKPFLGSWTKHEMYHSLHFCGRWDQFEQKQETRLWCPFVLKPWPWIWRIQDKRKRWIGKATKIKAGRWGEQSNGRTWSCIKDIRGLITIAVFPKIRGGSW